MRDGLVGWRGPRVGGLEPPRKNRRSLALAPKARFAGRAVLVAGDGLGFLLAVNRRRGIVGSGLDRVEAYEAFDRLLAEYVLAIELGHLRIDRKSVV